MRASLSGTPLEAVGHPVTASFGIAVVDGEAATLFELLRAADAAMYEDKRTRRRGMAEPLGDPPPRA